jgi:hypothetical protein
MISVVLIASPFTALLLLYCCCRKCLSLFCASMYLRMIFFLCSCVMGRQTLRLCVCISIPHSDLIYMYLYLFLYLYHYLPLSRPLLHTQIPPPLLPPLFRPLCVVYGGQRWMLRSGGQQDPAPRKYRIVPHCTVHPTSPFLLIYYLSLFSNSSSPFSLMFLLLFSRLSPPSQSFHFLPTLPASSVPLPSLPLSLFFPHRPLNHLSAPRTLCTECVSSQPMVR